MNETALNIRENFTIEWRWEVVLYPVPKSSLYLSMIENLKKICVLFFNKNAFYWQLQLKIQHAYKFRTTEWIASFQIKSPRTASTYTIILHSSGGNLLQVTLMPQDSAPKSWNHGDKSVKFSVRTFLRQSDAPLDTTCCRIVLAHSLEICFCSRVWHKMPRIQILFICNREKLSASG